ncbi:Acyl-CoA dehydrogenase domain protein OS=Tsukamurella paurometabola (strain ATCC 8368 / DSM/ CCUG 35730 / CIP 100753 / JCM 10117 / KCTC 9821 / NBRC 16120/ NCIMB 702349 / NCTC 13040) OX=521096 GN=Tpau_2827 PE=3 SV=1 [Tsukamurella paurometabola]|uniref:Acyl-CoA dehydrogenase domain protein n=1 Tax=Tsukamurella paurometabola (strain ATCC 8368 / DSM 20162 / CCUG 35730 / CIP 100753 / JCM 10117 / KCTC 9821 / NBRC 16120 / NCIMB 702349 / NCTC 13040) TaxID=521096 RepID=D5UTE0_TSUPD|nr:acyl-CoA dehydrogenase family protein [Tsukamurella paurometabola]ADG79425.1 acyl-CoA dehydrogenase domain protein [Tsukamurella paurometabola DSM 20162]SUP35677.1 Acyl-CoA dehydrogenase, short-chain specific [Tsukamurella paurometabola]
MTITAWDTEERRALHETVAAFTEREILPNLDQWEADGLLPRDLHRKAGELGLLGVSFPEAVGGGGGDPRDALVVCEAMHEAGGSGGLFASLFTCGISVPHIILAGTDEQKAKWVAPVLAGEKISSLAITEPGGGSDVGHLTTTARKDGDHYIVNGAKTFITSGVRADWVVTAVRTGGEGAAGISLLVIPKGLPGFEVSAPLKKLGWHASDTAELSFTDVRVPAENLIGPEGSGFLLIGAAFVTERLGLAVQAYSHAQRCLDLTLDWVRQRETFGEPLIKRQAVQNTVTEMRRRIEVARVYSRHVADLYTAALESGGPAAAAELVPQACFAKNTAVECGEWVANEAVQLFGGHGYMSEYEVSRHYRDVRILGIGGGTTQILTTLAANRLGYK